MNQLAVNTETQQEETTTIQEPDVTQVDTIAPIQTLKEEEKLVIKKLVPLKRAAPVKKQVAIQEESKVPTLVSQDGMQIDTSSASTMNQNNKQKMSLSRSNLPTSNIDRVLKPANQLPFKIKMDPILAQAQSAMLEKKKTARHALREIFNRKMMPRGQNRQMNQPQFRARGPQMTMSRGQVASAQKSNSRLASTAHQRSLQQN